MLGLFTGYKIPVSQQQTIWNSILEKGQVTNWFYNEGSGQGRQRAKVTEVKERALSSNASRKL